MHSLRASRCPVALICEPFGRKGSDLEKNLNWINLNIFFPSLWQPSDISETFFGNGQNKPSVTLRVRVTHDLNSEKIRK